MKKLLLSPLIIGFILIFASCQEKKNGFEISANLKGFSENSKVILSERQSAKILDSAFIKDGNFNFKGNLETSPTELSIVIFPTKGNETKYTTLFIGNENVTIKGAKKDFPSMLEIDGSTHQKLKSTLDQSTEPYNAEYDIQIQKMIEIRQKGNWNDSLQTAYWGKDGVFPKIDDEILQIKKEFISKNINTSFGLLQLNAMKNDLSKEYVNEQFSKINSEFKKSECAKSIQVYLENKPLKEDEEFYNFKAENQNGEIVEFSDFFNDGRYVLLEFYSPYCRWCKMALPEIKKLADTKKDSLKVVTFNVDKNRKDWLKTNKTNEITWQSLWDKDGRFSETFTKYRVLGTPTYYLFDNKGKVVNKWTGFEENTTVANIEQRIK